MATGCGRGRGCNGRGASLVCTSRSQSRCGAGPTRSGSAADTQAVTDYVKYFLDQHRMEYGKPPKVQVAANFFRQLCYQNKNALTAGIICAGWDAQKGGQVYSVPIGGALLELLDPQLHGSGSLCELRVRVCLRPQSKESGVRHPGPGGHLSERGAAVGGRHLNCLAGRVGSPALS